jgi:hypothetical protein
MTKRISPSDIVLFNTELGVAEQCQLDLPPRRPWSEAGREGGSREGGRPQHGAWISDADGD